MARAFVGRGGRTARGPGRGTGRAGDGRVRGRMLLGRGRGVPACPGRAAGGVRVCRRGRGDGALRAGEHEHDGPRRVSGSDLRPSDDFLRPAVARVLPRGARPHATQPPGPGRGDAVPLRAVLQEPGAASGGARHDHDAPARARLRRLDRDRARAAATVLRGRSLSSGLSGPPPRSAIHRVQRPAEARRPEAAVPGAVPAVTRYLRRMPAPVLVEACVDSIESALAAAAGGAHRIELCANLVEGGTTPSAGTLATCRMRLRIPIFVLVRPRGSDRRYTATRTPRPRAALT